MSPAAESVRRVVEALRRDLDVLDTGSDFTLELGAPGDRTPLMPEEFAAHYSTMFPCFVGFQDQPLSVLYVSGDLPYSDAAEVFAGQLQDVVIGAAFKAWPQCPWHPHPLVPTQRETSPVWVCPSKDSVIAEIGHLSKPLTE